MQTTHPFIVPLCQQQVIYRYQDDYLVVVDKPEPLLSTPGRLAANKDSVILRVQQQHPAAELVHRLDMATSGLMVIALSKFSTRELSIQFQQQRIHKCYTAVLQGWLEHDEGSIDLPIITDWPNRPLQKVCFETGKPSLTRYKVLERYNNHTTRVLFTPVTGRTHQLRLHSKAIGHPILGCQLYAQDHSQTMATRLLLHASTLTFEHPFSKQALTFTSAPPF